LFNLGNVKSCRIIAHIYCRYQLNEKLNKKGLIILDSIKKYQKLVNDTIPISQYMQWQIQSLQSDAIETLTSLAPNVNVHGTGFAGSVYSAGVATGWTLLKQWQEHHQYKATLVAAEANIKYCRPADDDLTCKARLDQNSDAFAKLIQRQQNNSSCAYPLKVEVICKQKVCAILEILFVFKV
jgi:thioesterase domain-containing protein